MSTLIQYLSTKLHISIFILLRHKNYYFLRFRRNNKNQFRRNIYLFIFFFLRNYLVVFPYVLKKFKINPYKVDLDKQDAIENT